MGLARLKPGLMQGVGCTLHHPSIFVRHSEHPTHAIAEH
nr:MAG TPA: hypothetical protein [Caudoviricetes sp.]